MAGPDLNLLVALSVLLEEGSVAKASRRLRLSPSAMSRTLARLRKATGDPLLVRAGRGLIPSPRALELSERVTPLVREGQSLLRPVEELDLKTVERDFALRTSDGFVENFGPRLLSRVSAEAPRIRLSFLQKADKDSGPLRDGRVDLETAVVTPGMSPELRTQALFRDRLIGVVNAEHPLSRGRISSRAYADARHVIVSRSGLEEHAVDRPFLPDDLRRDVGCIVGGFAAALSIASQSELVATVPELHTSRLRAGMFCFPLPMKTKGFTVSMVWHPRLDAEPVHRWMRACIRAVCTP